jgi:hypothetical protein
MEQFLMNDTVYSTCRWCADTWTIGDGEWISSNTDSRSFIKHWIGGKQKQKQYIYNKFRATSDDELTSIWRGSEF